MMINRKGAKQNRDATTLVVVGLMALFGFYGAYHLLCILPENPSLRQFVYFALCLGLVTAVVCGFMVLRRNQRHIERVAAVSVFLLGLLYLFAITPLSVPDESTHYQSAYELSNVFCFQWGGLEYGRASDFDYSGLEKHHNVSSAYSRVVEGIATEAEEDSLVPLPYHALAYPPEYVPQAVGIAIGRLFHANFVRTFFLGRLGNLLFYALCVYLAVRTIPKFKLLFSLIGMLPMALHQAASYSYDGFINGMSLLLIALLLRAIWRSEPFDRVEAAQIIIVGVLLAPGKFVQALFLLLVFLIPKERFLTAKRRVLFIVFALCLPLLLTCLLQLPKLNVSVLQSGERLNWEENSYYTVGFVLHHPVQTFKIFFRTFVFNVAEWFECSIGAYLSGLTLPIQGRTIYAYVLLLLIASWSRGEEFCIIQFRERAVFIGLSLIIVFLTMFYMLLTWTSDTRNMIEGVQGRYFITILPLVFLACNNRYIVVQQSVSRFVLLCAIALNIHVFLQIMTYTVLH